MNRRVALISLLAFAMAAASCGSGGDEPSTPSATEQASDGNGNSGNDGSTVEGDSGDDGGPAAASDDLPDSVPDDFEIPFPSGWEIDIHDEIGLVSSGTQLLYAEGRFDEIVAFYEEWTDSRPEDYAKTEASELVVFTRLDGTLWTITVSKDEQRDENWTLLQVTGGSAEAN